MVAAGSLEMPPLSSVEAAAAAEAAEAHGQLPAAAGAAAGAEATAQQLAGLWVSSADDGDAAQPTAAAAAPPAEAAPATGGAPDAAAAQPQAEAWQTAAAVRRTASFGDAVPSLSWGSQHRHQSPWKDAPSSRVLLRPSSARPRLGEGVDRGQAVFMLRAPDGSSSSGTALGSPGQADAAAPVPSPRLAACISLPAAFQDVPSLLTLGEGGLQPDPAAAATAAASRPPLPSLAEEVEAEAGGGSDASTSSPQQQHAASAAAPLPPAPGSSVAAADAAAAAAAGTGPVFVPICLAVPEEEYGVMLQDWLARRPPAAGSEWEPGGWAAASAESGRRLRQLQAHLRQYGASGVPVVEVSLSDMGQALDQLHAYVLLCIELALGEGPPAAAAAGGEAPA